MVEWISASGEHFIPTVRVIREIQGSLFNDPFIEAEIDFRDYATRIKTYPTVSGKREYDVTPVEHKWSSIIAINEWLSSRKEET